MGKTPRMATVVTLSLPANATDEQPTINITDIVMNKVTASFKCRSLNAAHAWARPRSLMSALSPLKMTPHRRPPNRQPQAPAGLPRATIAHAPPTWC